MTEKENLFLVVEDVIFSMFSCNLGLNLVGEKFSS